MGEISTWAKVTWKTILHVLIVQSEGAFLTHHRSNVHANSLSLIAIFTLIDIRKTTLNWTFIVRNKVAIGTLFARKVIASLLGLIFKTYFRTLNRCCVLIKKSC